MLSKEQLLSVCEDLTHPLHFIWFSIGNEYGVKPSTSDPKTFELRRNDFLALLGRLLNEGRLRLAKNGKFLPGSGAEQLVFFAQAFPRSDDEIDLGGAGTWFFTDACPGGAVWVTFGDDGQETFLWT